MSRGLSRRSVLGASLGAAAAARACPLFGADYASADEALAAIEGFEAEVERCLLRLERTLPASRAMIASFRRDRARHRNHRHRIRRRLGLPPYEAAVAPEAPSVALSALREAQSALVYAHAEALPTLGDAIAVSLLLADMVDLARHLTVLDLWIETEASRG